MTSLTIDNIDADLQRRLSTRAAANGHSLQDEARDILRRTVEDAPEMPQNPAADIRARFAPLGGVDFNLPPRGPMREPPSFDCLLG